MASYKICSRCGKETPNSRMRIKSVRIHAIFSDNVVIQETTVKRKFCKECYNGIK